MTKREKYNEYMREYMKRRYHERKAESLVKLGGKCVICGTTENLEFDHIDRTTKTMDINTMWSVNRKRYEEELKLIQLLCAPHHQAKTSAEQSVPHGGGLTGKRNCRCELCAPLKNAYSRELKRKKRQRVSSSMEETSDF